jgi:hypothetical protein
MIKILITLILVANFGNTALTNSANMHELILKEINKLITIYKDMTDEDRNFLFKTSFREAGYLFLLQARYNNGDYQTQQIQKTKGAQELRAQLGPLIGFSLDNYGDEAETINTTMAKATKSYNRRFEAYKIALDQIDAKKAELENLKIQLETADSSFNETIHNLKKVTLLHSLIDSGSFDWNNSAKIFSEVEELLPDPKISALISAFKNDYSNYSAAIKIKTAYEKANKDFSLEKNKTIKGHVDAISSTASNFLSKLNKTKNNVAKVLKTYMDSKTQLLNQNNVYQAYLAKVQEVEKIVKQNQKIHLEMIQLSREISKTEYVVESLFRRSFRVSSADVMDRELKLIDLEGLIHRIDANKTQNEANGQTYAAQVSSFFSHSQVRLAELRTLNNKIRNEYELYHNLYEQDTELDQYLALLFAELQGGLKPPSNFVKPFSDLELSVMFYYMSIFQIIVNPKAFYAKFTSSIPASDALFLTKQIFQDLRGNAFVDPKMIDLTNGQFAEEGLERAANNFDLMVNDERDFIFEKLLPEYKKKNRFFNKVLRYAGIGALAVGNFIKNKSIVFMCKSIAIAIITVLSVAVAPIVIAVLITMFLVLLVKAFTNWAYHAITTNPTVLYEFNKGITWITSMFSKENIMSPEDYLLILDQVNKEEYNLQIKARKSHQIEPKSKDRSSYYSKKYDEVSAAYLELRIGISNDFRMLI